ncbi:stage V sporulation protein B, partial [Bacillus sp. SIMBA_008]
GMIFVLASQPGFGIMGAALAILIGIVLVTLLHAATVGKVLPIHLPMKEYGICVLVIIGTGVVSLWLKSQMNGFFSAPIELVMLIFVTCALYV